MKNKKHDYLITTPRGLGELHKVHPKGWALEGTDRVVSTDDAFGSAYRAHQLHGWVGRLAKAGDEVWRDCEPAATRKKAPGTPRAAEARSLARLQGALSVVKEGYAALTPGRKALGGSKLFADAGMLEALVARHGTLSWQGKDGFISWEMVVRDAKVALTLEQDLLRLFRAAAAVHAACKAGKGVPTPEAHKALGAALDDVRGWSWKESTQSPRIDRHIASSAAAKPRITPEREPHPLAA